MRLIFALCLLLLSGLFAHAQIEYGKPEELKNLKKIHIDAAGDIDDYNRIKKELEKSKIEFTFVERAEESEIVLRFDGGRQLAFVGSGATQVTNNYYAGKGTCFVFGARAMRVIMQSESVQDKWTDKKPAVKFARDFLKVYKKANNIK